MTNNLEKIIFIFQTQLTLGMIHILYTFLIFTVKRLKNSIYNANSTVLANDIHTSFVSVRLLLWIEKFHHRQSKACILSVNEVVLLPKISTCLDFSVQKSVYLSSKQCPIRKI